MSSPLEIALAVCALALPILGALVKLFVLDEIKRLREWRHQSINQYADVQVLQLDVAHLNERVDRLERKVWNGLKP